MSTAPDVSILLPTRNRAHLIERAIKSVLAQTFTNFELIVVDGASTDATADVVARFDDPRIVYLREETPRGAAAGENRGIAAARAEYIAFIDDDDEWLPSKLETQWSRFLTEGDETGVIYTGRWLDKNGSRLFGPPLAILAREGRIYRELLNRTTFVPLVCAMVRKRCFDAVGLFDERLPTSNDYDLWVRMSEHFRFVYVPEPLVIVHPSPDSISTNADNIIAARRMLLEKHAEALKRSGKNVAAFFHWQIGTLLIARGDVVDGRRHLAKAFLERPLRGVYAASWLTSLLGRDVYLEARSRLHRWASPLRGA